MTRSRRASRRELGRPAAFTLLEVLTSIVLVAIIMPAVMKGVSIVTALAGSAKERFEAASLADAKLAELLATGEWQEGGSSGDFEPDFPGYGWTAEVEQWQDTTLQEVKVGVYWTRRGRTELISLTTLGRGGS